jgi:hypothetical protein
VSPWSHADEAAHGQPRIPSTHWAGALPLLHAAEISNEDPTARRKRPTSTKWELAKAPSIRL